MTSPVRLPRPGRSLPAHGLGVVLAAGALALSGCSGGSGSADASGSARPSAPPVTLPSGAAYTASGTTLQPGAPATVLFEPNPQRAAALQLSVTGATEGSIEDLRGYRLPASADTATPYYVKVRVQNLAGSDLARLPVPLYAVGDGGDLIGASSFTRPFAACASTPLPAPFAAGADLSTCLMYLMPSGTSLTGVAFRSAGTSDEVLWSVPGGSGAAGGTPTTTPTTTPTAPTAQPSAVPTPAPTVSPSVGATP